MNETERQAAALRIITNAQVQVENTENHLKAINESLQKITNILCLDSDCLLSELVETVIKLKTRNDELEKLHERGDPKDEEN